MTRMQLQRSRGYWNGVLRELVNCPLAGSGFDHDQRCHMRVGEFRLCGFWKQRDRKSKAAGSELPSAGNFKALRSCVIGEQAFQECFRAALFKAVGEQEGSGFLVLRLPGMEKLIGGGEGVNVVGVDRGWDGLGSCHCRDIEDREQQAG